MLFTPQIYLGEILKGMSGYYIWPSSNQRDMPLSFVFVEAKGCKQLWRRKGEVSKEVCCFDFRIITLEWQLQPAYSHPMI